MDSHSSKTHFKIKYFFLKEHTISSNFDLNKKFMMILKLNSSEIFASLVPNTVRLNVVHLSFGLL